MRKLLICALLLLALCLAAPMLGSAAHAEVMIEGLPYDRYASRLDLTGLRVTDVEALKETLRSMPRLREADLTDCNLSDEALDSLRQELAEYRVKIVWTLTVGKNYRLRTDAWVFSTQHSSNDHRLEDKDVACLRYATELRALDLGHNWIFDISFVEPMTQLRVVVLSDNRITDFSPLAGKPLEYLEIFNNKVSDISFLEGCDTLLDLNICDTHVADLSPLYQLKSLKRLWVGDMKEVTAAERDRFLSYQKENMEAYNFWTDIPTMYGWRGDEKGPGHPRYEIVKAMFHEGVYYDFDTVLAPEQYVVLNKNKKK